MKPPFNKIWSEKDESELEEKHIPIVEVNENEGVEIYVKVGEKMHPSEPGHFIQWIEIIDGEVPIEKVCLSPMSKSEAIFYLKDMPDNLKVRIFCNLHGAWEYKEE